jgi:hypothetical protein
MTNTQRMTDLNPIESGEALENLALAHQAVLTENRDLKAENALLKTKLRVTQEELREKCRSWVGDGDPDWPRRRSQLQKEYLNGLREKEARKQLGLSPI